MAECRRCGATISQADIQKGRALQRGEFMYCPDCVAEARAAKGGSAASGAQPAASSVRKTGASSAAARPAPSAMKPAPGSAIKAAPPSSRAMKAAPASAMKAAPASAMKAAPPSSVRPAPSSKKGKFSDLIDEDQGAGEEESPAPARSPGSRIGRASGGGTSRIRKGVVPGGRNGEMEEPSGSGSLRRPIGFKDNRGAIGQPMSKQSFMMWVVGGGAVFIIAVVLFMTLIVGRMKTAEALKKRNELAKEHSQELERIMREEPNNFDAMDEALEKFKEVAPGTKLAENAKDFEKAIDKRKADSKGKKTAMALLNEIFGLFGQPGGAEAALLKVREAHKLVTGVGWYMNEQSEYQQLQVRVLKSAKEKAEAAKAAVPQDWNVIAGYYLIAGELDKLIPPEQLAADERQKMQKDVDEAIEKRYDSPGYLETLTWLNLNGADTDWKHDESMPVSRSGDDVVLNNAAGGEKAALYWLNQPVNWKDYVVEMEFTVEGGPFQVLQRTQPEQPPGATHDLEVLIGQNYVKMNEKNTVQFWVYSSRFRVAVGEIKARPGFCAPTAPKKGGITLRIPVGTKVTIHKMQVKVMMTEGEAEVAPAK
ncbi:MAG: hypothetical protein HYY18_21975 [Planctomycetes bacterium]|nr:hypothetical protein [Planctomycetota bacterium]